MVLVIPCITVLALPSATLLLIFKMAAGDHTLNHHDVMTNASLLNSPLLYCSPTVSGYWRTGNRYNEEMQELNSW